MQQRAVRCDLVELVHRRRQVGGVLVDAIDEGGIQVKLGDHRAERRRADLNAVGELVRRSAGNPAAKIRMEGEVVITEGAECRRCKRRRGDTRRRQEIGRASCRERVCLAV